MINTDIQISKLVDMDNPQIVFNEVKSIISLVFQEFDSKLLDEAFSDTLKLFYGEYPGYRKCNTKYHDLKHTMDAFLAMARIIHGAIVAGEFISPKNLCLALVSTLMHDVGYIQTTSDTAGTGAKYTRIHIQRSIEFMGKYFIKKDISEEDFKNCAHLLECTGLDTNIRKIDFKSKEIELLGKMLGSSDLLGQMADRIYLEKLLLLFHEYQEGGIPGYDNELDLLKKTINFYKITRQRLADELSGVNKYMRYHFKNRWDIDLDLYEISISKNEKYLKYILSNHEQEYLEYLRRYGIISDIKKRVHTKILAYSKKLKKKPIK